jgi:hypothetical protein
MANEIVMAHNTDINISPLTPGVWKSLGTSKPETAEQQRFSIVTFPENQNRGTIH